MFRRISRPVQPGCSAFRTGASKPGGDLPVSEAPLVGKPHELAWRINHPPNAAPSHAKPQARGLPTGRDERPLAGARPSWELAQPTARTSGHSSFGGVPLAVASDQLCRFGRSPGPGVIFV